MCGLVAVITKNLNGLNRDQVDAFDHLLYIDALRGEDSTGVFSVDKDGDMEWAKEASASYEFRKHKDYEALMGRSFQRGAALVGHNRAATKGSIIDENAHPFTVDDRITLVHNGTLYGDHRTLANVDVDSHAIAHVIHNNGDDVEKALQQVHGAFALIWHDHKNKTLNFVRNTSRPLHWVETDRGWIWASEKNMIDWILSKYPNLKAVSEPALLPEGILCTYTQGKNGWSVDTKKIQLTAPYKYTPPAVNYQSRGTGGPATQHYGNGFYGHDEDDGATDNWSVQSPVCDVPFRPAQSSTNVVAAIKDSYKTPAQIASGARMAKYEMEMAHDMKLDIPSPQFLEEGYSIKDGELVPAICFNYTNVSESDPSKGYFLYAQLEANPDFLVRIWVPPIHKEEQVLGLAVDAQRVLVRPTSRYWRCYTDASWGAGYGMFSSDYFRVIPAKEDVDVEANMEYIGQ